MTTHDVGDAVPLFLDATDTAGDPADPATVDLEVFKPDGTAAPGPFTILNPAVGSYESAVTVDTAGGWEAVWTTTGPANVERETFTVVARRYPLATIGDLEFYLGRDLTPAERRVAPGQLHSASTRVRSHCHQTFHRVDDDVVTLRPMGNTLRLPQLPVIDITSVTAIGGGVVPDVPLTGYGFDGIDVVTLGGVLNADIFVALPAIVSDRDFAASSFRVVYSHGYDLGQYPDDVVDVVANAALRSIVSTSEQAGLTQLTVGSYSEQHQQAQGTAGRVVYLTKAEKTQLAEAGLVRFKSDTIQLQL